MEGTKRNFLKKRSNSQFKRKGAPRKGQGKIYVREQPPESSYLSETIYRILCRSKKIGSVIGKGGNIVKALREATQAKITVSESVPGSDERVIIIFSPSDKRAKRYNDNKDGQDRLAGQEDDAMKPQCAAQDALLKVHDRIAEEDLRGSGKGGTEDENEIVITARLLVPNNVVGCLLGRKGDVIQRLRNETSANIRVLPADQLPACAMSTDELVQISGRPAIAKKALYEVSTLLHRNPRKDKPPLGFNAPNATQGFPHVPPFDDMLPPGNLPWMRHEIDSHSLPPMPWKGEYETRPSGYERDDFDGVPPHGREAPSEFTMKILCSAEKIGSVIGKGGFNVKQLQQETGASIHVESPSAVSDERVIRISSLEVLWDQRSQTIDTILQLQNRTSEYSEKGTIMTRLLVPSSKVGCILGQGGHVINEMRRRTGADIRVFSKEDKPKCASEDEELVQISGNVGVAKDALAEIASRLRTRCLRDVNARTEPPPPVNPVSGFGPTRSMRDGGLPLPSSIGAGSSGRNEYSKGGFREYEAPSFPVPPRATGYPSGNHVMEARKSNNTISSVMGSGGIYATEIGGTRMKIQDLRSGVADHFNASKSSYQSFASSSNLSLQDAYSSYNSQHDSYNMNPRVPYYDSNPQQAAYKKVYSQRGPYHNPSTPGPYPY